jgi:hypothetical protein
MENAKSKKPGSPMLMDGAAVHPETVRCIEAIQTSLGLIASFFIFHFSFLIFLGVQ